MMDKNEIIERLERLARCAVHTVGELPFVMSLDDGIAIHEAIDMLRSQPELHWIPCNKKLPSKADHTDDMVLVCYRNGSVRFNTYMNGWAQGNPVAWMPLPEPYKGGKHETD